MELYDQTSQSIARLTLLRYSSSFGTSSRLFGADIRPHIYNIYGLVRFADEIVDTYQGVDAASLLDELETQNYASLQSGFSTNPIVHAFCLSARQFGIGRPLIRPFFSSMRMDLAPLTYTSATYKTYIHGSAEVIGLMCLKVFVGGDREQYQRLAPGAARLGAAYQKVNFLRDLAADSQDLHRFYFPGYSLETFDDQAKQSVVEDINRDFAVALPALRQLPKSARRAVGLSAVYYQQLLQRLAAAPVAVIKQRRLRLSKAHKLRLLAMTLLRRSSL